MSSASSIPRRQFIAAPFVLSSRLRAAQARQGLKIFMHCDMDGASGIFTREQAWYWENGVPEKVALEARELFTADVNAASAAALAAGVTQLIVCDTHHGGGNLIREKLLSDARITYLYRSVGMENGKRRWMPGMDETVDGLMLPGHHAKAFTEGAFLPHTWNFEWVDFTINGQSVGEIGIETCYAGHWGVPLIFVQGDEAACYEARRQFPGVVTAAVKHGTTESCTGLAPDAAHKETARRVAEAIESARRNKPQPYRPKLPMTITLRMRTMDAAAKAAQRPGVLRLDDHTVEARVGRQCDVVKWLLGTGLDMAPASS
ncbi:MAG TPA: M55 family metallopeptidase [Bryobacteraceae bacterium]|nr:M55 family metallopeptidase [Bryobacteraceae bacterium]